MSTLIRVRHEWSSMGDDLEASWARIAPRVALLTASAQLGAARSGAAYVEDALAQQRQTVAPVAQVVPRGLVGVASDGRSLEELLYSSVVAARSAKVGSLPERLRVGGLWLDGIVQTQVSDAARDAAKVAMTVRPGVRYVRFVNPPCCQRCAVLAGEAREYSHPFQRHPRCDCSMVPTTVVNPDFAGEKLTAADVTDLTQKQKDALEGGANFHSTINDYQRKRGDFSGYLPPTRVDKVIDRAGQRDKAAAALAELGILI
ncbi:hypothetical protein [Terrabacter sp. C0L_2]|uniref:hypothetical protein n=1 Tax=Terrabacter sp. C0L_2 TaxID=3108389 RepID=UPI002ED2CADD|nr:hypothetical protein U5C87_17755 [Terrabacter sp. C0L_2]